MTTFNDRGPRSRVPGIEPPVFDIPAQLYSPSFKRAKPNTIKVFIKGNKMARIGRETSEIYDLEAQTVTTLFNRIHRYSVKSFNQTSNELNHAWLGISSRETYSAIAQKTGETTTLQGQTAEKYLIFGIGHLHGRNRVAGSSIYWLVGKTPSDEEREFRAKWIQKCNLPYPRPEVTVAADTTVFGAMARAASQLDGYSLLSIVEQRPPAELEKLNRVSSGYSADEPGISPGATSGQWGVSGDSNQIYATQSEVNGFSNEPIKDDVFAIPAGYKLQK